MPRHSNKSVSGVSKPADEKISLNIGCVDLGQIDLLVQEGFYSNRTDLIRTAVRNQLARHSEVVGQAAARKMLALGVFVISKTELQALKAGGKKIDVRVLGLAIIDSAVSPELARETISSLTVLGTLRANPDVKAALAGRSQ